MSVFCLSRRQAVRAGGNPAHARQSVKRTVSVHAKRAESAVAGIETVEVTAVAAHGQVNRAWTGHAGHAICVEQLQASVRSDAITTDRAAASVGRIGEAFVARQHHPASGGFGRWHCAADGGQFAVVRNFIRWIQG